MCEKKREKWMGQQDVVSRPDLETGKMLKLMGEEEQLGKLRTGHRATSIGTLRKQSLIQTCWVPWSS
jgi:hypothetical protein